MDLKDEIGQTIAREIAHSIARKIAIGIALFLAFLVFIVLGGLVVQLLWNWLLPGIFSVRQVTFWEALGLLALCRILFGGFGRGGSSHDPSGRRRRREWWKKQAERRDAESPDAPPAQPQEAP
jgi:hypothetical protein